VARKRVYAATKAAVLVIPEPLRQEVKPYNIRTTVIFAGAMRTELVDSITELDVKEGVCRFMDIAASAATFANVVSFVISQPENVDINEICSGRQNKRLRVWFRPIPMG